MPKRELLCRLIDLNIEVNLPSEPDGICHASPRKVICCPRYNSSPRGREFFPATKIRFLAIPGSQ